MSRTRSFLIPVVLAALLAAVWAAAPVPMGTGATSNFYVYEQTGEALLHGVVAHNGSVSYNMPLSSLIASALSHSPAALRKLAGLLASAAAGGLIVATGVGARSPWAGVLALAALILSSPGSWFGSHGYPQSMYAVFVLAVACAAVWRLRKRTPGSAVALGACIGASILFRSPQIVLAPVFLAVETFLFGKIRRREILIVLALAYGGLLPWAVLTRVLDGRVVFMEVGRADTNLMAGAVGFLSDGESDVGTIVGGSELRSGGGAGGFLAAAEVAAGNPGIFLWSVLRRMARVFSLAPVLAAGFLAGLLALFLRAWSKKKTSEHNPAWGAAVVAVVFLLPHCMIGFEPWYFEPFWPLAALTAALGFLPRANEDERLTQVCGAALRVYSGVCGFALAAAAVFIFSYAARHSDALELESSGIMAASARRPGDGWLKMEAGRSLIRQERFSEAVLMLGEAARLRPEDFRARSDWAWARALSGDAVPLAGLELPEGYDIREVEVEFHLRRYAARKSLNRVDASEAWAALESVYREDHEDLERVDARAASVINSLEFQRSPEFVALIGTLSRQAEAAGRSELARILRAAAHF